MRERLPTYLVRPRAELLWIAWAAALVGLSAAIGVALGVPAEVITAWGLFVTATARLLTGLLLPTPPPDVPPVEGPFQ